MHKEFDRLNSVFAARLDGCNAGQVIERAAAHFLNGEFIDSDYDVLADGLRYEIKTINIRTATMRSNVSVSTPHGWNFISAHETCEQLARRIVGTVFDVLLVIHTEETRDGYVITAAEMYDGEDAVEYILAAASSRAAKPGKAGDFGGLRLASNPESTKSGGQTARHATLIKAGHAIR